MTNDIVKIKSVAASQGGETEHGLMLDSSILSYTYQGSSKTVKWILDTIFTLLGGKAETSTTYTKTEVDTALAEKVGSFEIDGTHTSGSSTIDVDEYLTSYGTMGLFHIYNGRTADTELSDLLSSTAGAQFYIYGTSKVSGNGGDILCSICKHGSSSEPIYIVFIHDKVALVTAMSAQSTDLQYPSAKCVYDGLVGKANKVSNATNGNFAALNSNGNLTDSGKKANDFADRVHYHHQIGNVDGVVSVGIEQQEGEEDLTMIQFDSDVIKGDAVRNDIADVDYGERKILTSGAIKAALDALESRIAALES